MELSREDFLEVIFLNNFDRGEGVKSLENGSMHQVEECLLKFQA